MAFWQRPICLLPEQAQSWTIPVSLQLWAELISSKKWKRLRAYCVSFSTGKAGWNQDFLIWGGESLLDMVFTDDWVTADDDNWTDGTVASRDIGRTLRRVNCHAMMKYRPLKLSRRRLKGGRAYINSKNGSKMKGWQESREWWMTVVRIKLYKPNKLGCLLAKIINVH